MTFSEKVSEHGFLREVAQTGAPQEVARGAVMEQTGGTEEGARIQMSNTFLEKSQNIAHKEPKMALRETQE